MPTLQRITVYPIKSLDGVDVPSARVTLSGALEHDRRWAIVDGQGRYINGKRTAALHAVRPTFDTAMSRVTLSGAGPTRSFSLTSESPGIAAWMSSALGLACRLIENPDGGFPDDADASGPTVVSTASLETAASWFTGIDAAEMRRRIRANLEIAAPAPFWEDRLADHGGRVVRFSIRAARYRGRTICQRCAVPTRDSQTGAVSAGFARDFARRREQTLPDESPCDAFDHFYRLALNTSPEGIADGAVLNLGDELVVR